LPNKILKKINDIHLIIILISRLKLLSGYDLCVATSKNNEDDKIEKLCIKNEILCYRDSLENVAKRLLNTAEYFNAEAFVRINGDSPLLDPQIVEKAVSIYKYGNYDLVTNTFPRSFPIGQSIEVIRTRTFKKAYQKMRTKDHFEHVTKYYYEHPEDFRIKNFKNNRDLTSYRLVVDTPEDLDRIKNIIGMTTKPYVEYSMNELIDLYPHV